MTSLAHVVCSIAEIDRDAAAEDALPAYVLSAMLLAHGVPRAIHLQLTVFAKKIFFRGGLFEAHLDLTVNHAAKVRLLALVALIEGTRVHGKAE